MAGFSLNGEADKRGRDADKCGRDATSVAEKYSKQVSKCLFLRGNDWSRSDMYLRRTDVPPV